MKGFLLAEEGPFTGLVIRLDEGDEWIIGRDPDVCYQVIEDPMVSRKHVIIRLDNGEFVAENLSAVNPASINGKHITEPSHLQEGDTLQVGNVALRFTLSDPSPLLKTSEHDFTDEHSETPSIFDEGDRLDAFTFTSDEKSRWIVKVVSGPNTGAEFSISKGSSHVLGKDPHGADIVFQDLSVSKQHARLLCDENNALSIEDLRSRNGIAVNGRLIHDPTLLASQDSIVLGTTHLLIIDTEAVQDTVVSPPPLAPVEEDVSEEAATTAKRDWKTTVIPFRHIAIASVFVLVLALIAGGVISLFSSATVVVETVDESSKIADKLEKFPDVQYSFTDSTGKLFLLGNVMTEVDHQELIYLVKTLPFVRSIEDNVVIDELVWENTNAMLMKYPNWRGVYLTSSKPGRFVLRGYVDNPDEAGNLEDWMNSNFSYTDRLTNSVVVEQTLMTRIQALLITEGFATVTFTLTNGEVTLAGRIPQRTESNYNALMNTLKKIDGVRNVKSYVIVTKLANEYIDLSNKYTVTGTSKLGTVNQFVVINGKILSKGEDLDGMVITNIAQNEIFLEKDGLKYKINYNQQ